MDEFEGETFRRASAGDAEARRDITALAADALIRGAPMSSELRGFVANALQLVLCVPGTASGAQALAAFGIESNPMHRPGRSESEKRERALRFLAAVHLLTNPARSKSQAVAIVAVAAGCGEGVVWGALRTEGEGAAEWTAGARPAMRLARDLIRNARRAGLLRVSR